jgi:hypothetical protein
VERRAVELPAVLQAVPPRRVELEQHRALTPLEWWLLAWIRMRRAEARALRAELLRLPQLLRNLHGCWSSRWTARRPSLRLHLLRPLRRVRRQVVRAADEEPALLEEAVVERVAAAAAPAELLAVLRPRHFR